MDDATLLLAWLLVALVGVMTPGPDTLLVLRHTLLSSRRAGFATVIGIAVGYLGWACASLAGLTALLAASQLAYDLVRIAGAAYLIWLGGAAIWHSFHRQLPAGGLVNAPQTKMGTWTALRTGAVTNLLNPKVGVFYISILPQFLPSGSGALAWGAMLVGIHITVTFAWFTLIIWTAGKARRLLLNETMRAWLDRISGMVMVSVGVKLATETR
ncbi:LysE family translocator [Pseudaminobacter sp. NGMCC 1.201702]|uniref:LysE family translocator n=1 Tax=Pseudaminobacter sp. NGMCC 1.201702 TaxID=3391825 RepID=UPI0039EFFFE7